MGQTREQALVPGINCLPTRTAPSTIPTIRHYRLEGGRPTEAPWPVEILYWKVDPEGNQLPYIDRVSQQLISDTELMVMKAISGEIDFQIRHFHNRWLDFPLLMQNAESGKYRVLLWNSDYAGAAVLYFNLNTKNPVLRPLFNDSRFRIALSLAIDRDEINELVFLGAGAPQQPFLTPGSPAYDESTARRYTEYDPARANELLDEIGLTQRDSAGYRLSPDGQPIVINIEVRSGVSQEQVTTAELFADYWSKVGIRAVVKAEERSSLKPGRKPENMT